MKRKYQVYIDDNYHYMDKSERYVAGSYSSLEEAVERCKEITIKSLEHHYENGITPEDLSAQWAMFGEDPFIRVDPFITGADEQVPFSARKFITIGLCKSIIDLKKSH